MDHLKIPRKFLVLIQEGLNGAWAHHIHRRRPLAVPRATIGTETAIAPKLGSIAQAPCVNSKVWAQGEIKQTAAPQQHSNSTLEWQQDGAYFDQFGKEMLSLCGWNLKLEILHFAKYRHNCRHNDVQRVARKVQRGKFHQTVWLSEFMIWLQSDNYRITKERGRVQS